MLSGMAQIAADKVRENRLRFAADRQGLRLIKSRQRDPRGLLYGRYALVDIGTGGNITENFVGTPYAFADLDEVEEFLSSDTEEPADG